MLKKVGLSLLLGLYIVLGIVYSVTTPIMEASDELWHYPMAKYIADHWSLPVQEPGVETPWRQEGSQPPLYYWVSAVLTSWIDTSDLAQVRWTNPHADSGIIRPDGNTNLIVHSPAERFPWRGSVLAIHLIRFLSVGMGAGIVYLTYLLAVEIWPRRVGTALGAAAITAFNPMFCFISGSVNNDNLAMLLGAAGIWLLVRAVRRHGAARPACRSVWWRDVTVLGAVLGLGMLTKPSTVGLLLLAALAVSYVAWRRRSWWHFWTGGTVTAGLVLLIAGWWFVRNAVLYDGDWMGIERFIVVLGYRDPPATMRQLWGERHGFMMAFWGLFGGVNVPMPAWVYGALNGAALVSALGLVVGLVRRAVRRGPKAAWRCAISCPTVHSLQLALLLLWPVLVVVPWITWATRTWSSQGRLVFTAMSAWSTWAALGLGYLMPGRWSSVLPACVGVFMLGIAVWAPGGVIAPAYRPPVLPAGEEPHPEHVLRADLGGQLRLLGYDLEAESARPGGAFRFTLYWEAQTTMDRSWSIFCHILDQETGLPLATRDRYPGQGLLATTRMQPGLRWADRYVVELPETAYAPGEAMLEIGLYDVTNNERPPILIEVGEGVEIVENALRFQPLHVEPRAGDVPNPVRINFEDQMALVGWELDPRVAAPGQVVQLSLYWECIGQMRRDYTVFTQIVDDGGLKWAQWDAWPADMATSQCQRGQRIKADYDLLLDPNTPSGAKTAIIGIYWMDPSGALERLRLIDDDGRVLPSPVLTLDQIRTTESQP